MSSAAEFIDHFYQAIIRKELETIRASYWPEPETYVILEGPRLATQGYTKIAEGWGDFCQSAITLQGIEWLEGPFEYPFADSITLAGVIRLWGSIPGMLDFDNTFRTTFLLKKTETGFNILHEHVSGAMSDPYGIGDWKKKNT
jgi:hypothetical protein